MLGIVASSGLGAACRDRDRSVAAIQDEVARWAKTWHLARRCLVGDQPAARNGAAALSAYVATSGDAAIAVTKCKHLLPRPGQEARQAAPSAAWTPLDAAAATLLDSYTLGLAKSRADELGGEHRRAIGRAITAVDEAYAVLRQAASMEPKPPPGAASLPELPSAAIIEVEPYEEIELSGRSLMILGKVAGHDTLVRASGLEAVTRQRIPADFIELAMDDSAWGYRHEMTGKSLTLYAGALDENGRPHGEETAVLTGKHAASEILGAIGNGAHRAIVFKRSRGFKLSIWIVKSADRGATWSKPTRLLEGDAETESITALVDAPRGRVDLTWDASREATAWLSIRRDNLAREPRWQTLTFRRERFSGPSVCYGDQAAWWIENDMIRYTSAENGSIANVANWRKMLDRPRQIASIVCTDNHLLIAFREDANLLLYLCDESGCGDKMLMHVPNWYQLVLTLANAQPLLVSQIDDIIIAASPSGETRIYQLANSAMTLKHVVVWQRGPVAVLQDPGDARVHLAPL